MTAGGSAADLAGGILRAGIIDNDGAMSKENTTSLQCRHYRISEAAFKMGPKNISSGAGQPVY